MQVVMRLGFTTDGAFYSAKKWGAIATPILPFTFNPEFKYCDLKKKTKKFATHLKSCDKKYLSIPSFFPTTL